jgi:3-hydroxy-9,10-secoandrosta-1,3,5(10)-triene-9,17-dione monooxygenase
MLGGTSPGAEFHTRPIYRMPFADLAPFSIIGAPLGMARGAADSFAVSLKKGLGDKDELHVAQQSTTFARLAEACADIDAALALVIEDATRIDTAATPDALSPVERARISRDWAYAAQKARYATTLLFEASGGSGIYEGSAIQRMWRDVNSAAQHFAFTWDSAMTSFGRAKIGTKQGEFALRGRS